MLFFKANKLKTGLRTLKNLPSTQKAFAAFPSGKIFILSNSFWHLPNRLSEFYHVKIRKDWKLLSEDLIVRLERFSNTLQKRYLEEKEAFIKKGPATQYSLALRKKFHAFFDIIEEIYLTAQQIEGKNRIKIMELAKKLYEKSIKENDKILKPLHFFTEIYGGFHSLALDAYQILKEKPWNEEVYILSKAGVYLAELTTKAHKLGDWLHYIDLEGKQKLFFDVSQNLLYAELKKIEERNHPKEAEKFKSLIDLLHVYLEGLLNPHSISAELTYSLEKAFNDKSNEIESNLEQPLDNLKFIKGLILDAKEKLKILNHSKDQKEQEFKKLQQKLISKSDDLEKDLPIDKLLVPLPKIPEPLLPYKTDLEDAYRTIQVILQLKKGEPSLKQTQEKLFQIGLIRPSLEELKEKETLLSSFSIMLPFEKALSASLDAKFSIEKEKKILEDTIEKTEESLQKHIKELKESPYAEEKKDLLELLKKDLGLVKNYAENLKNIKENLMKLNLPYEALFVTKEDLYDDFSNLSHPANTEGPQGKLPSQLSHLQESYERLLQAIEKKESCLLTPLILYQKSLEKSLKEIESVYFLLDEKLTALDLIKKSHGTNEFERDMIVEKELAKLNRQEIIKEAAAIEKELRILKGISALQTTFLQHVPK